MVFGTPAVVATYGTAPKTWAFNITVAPVQAQTPSELRPSKPWLIAERIVKLLCWAFVLINIYNALHFWREVLQEQPLQVIAIGALVARLYFGPFFTITPRGVLFGFFGLTVFALLAQLWFLVRSEVNIWNEGCDEFYCYQSEEQAFISNWLKIRSGMSR
jgi:hypothetical protein